mgnify:FL=1
MKKIGQFFKKHWKKFLLAIIIIAVIVVIIYLSFRAYDRYRENLLRDPTWIRENVNFVENDEGVYEVEKDEEISIFSEDYQNIIEEKIEELKDKDDYTLEDPLLILNPYGTGSLSYYLYYTDSEEDLDYKIETEGYSNFEKEISHKDSNEYQLIGFVPGETNTLTLTSGDEEYEFTITTPKSESDIDTQVEVVEGDSEEELTDGLYALLGHDKNYNSNIYLYDNDGVLREEFVLDSYRADRIIFDDDYMYYAYNKKGIVKVNDLGKIEEFYDLGKYSMHHDMIYDKDNNRFVILVNEDGTDTIEDVIITLDLDTKKVEKIVDMKDLLPEFYLNAIKPEGKNTYGGYELDWIHLNSLSLIGDDIVLSSRELSTIIYISDAYTEPSVKYLLTDESVTEDTSYGDLLYEKVGDFVPQAGQHSITYYTDETLEDGEYYLYMFNNNYKGARTRPNFDWANYPGAGTYEKGETSYFYQYKVNENDKTYELVKSFEIPYSSIVSDVEILDGGNIVAGSGKDNSYGEYDNDGNLIRQFNYNSKKYAYRIFKYEFNNLFD